MDKNGYKKNSYLLSLNCGKRYFHNHSTSCVGGILCSDCGRFIDDGTLEYFMTTGHDQIWNTLHNRQANFKRGKTLFELNDELKNLMDLLENKSKLIKMTKEQAENFMNETYLLLDKYKIKDDEAIVYALNVSQVRKQKTESCGKI